MEVYYLKASFVLNSYPVDRRKLDAHSQDFEETAYKIYDIASITSKSNLRAVIIVPKTRHPGNWPQWSGWLTAVEVFQFVLDLGGGNSERYGYEFGSQICTT